MPCFRRAFRVLFLRAAACMILGGMVAAPAAAAGLSIVDPGQGLFGFSGSGAGELSGLTYAGGNTWYAISDSSPVLYPLTIGLNTTTGSVSSASVGAGLVLKDSGGSPLASGMDVEGVAYDASSGTVFASNESEPGIRQHHLTTGNELLHLTPGSHPQLGVFANQRSNLSWESLTRNATGSVTWTANEEALNGDGPEASETVGSAVRLQRFDGSLTPNGQWGYVTDPHMGPNGFISGLEASGVVDLAVLGDGQLLVLERALGGTGGILGLPQFRSRIYLVDFTGASEVSALSALDTGTLNDLSDETWTPVSKALLWEGTFSQTNFEGMALGPALSGGGWSLLLVSDNGNSTTQSLYALQLVPEPSGWLLLLVGHVILAAKLSRSGLGRSRGLG